MIPAFLSHLQFEPLASIPNSSGPHFTRPLHHLHLYYLVGRVYTTATVHLLCWAFVGPEVDSLKTVYSSNSRPCSTEGPCHLSVPISSSLSLHPPPPRLKHSSSSLPPLTHPPLPVWDSCSCTSLSSPQMPPLPSWHPDLSKISLILLIPLTNFISFRSISLHLNLVHGPLVIASVPQQILSSLK